MTNETEVRNVLGILFYNGSNLQTDFMFALLTTNNVDETNNKYYETNNLRLKLKSSGITYPTSNAKSLACDTVNEHALTCTRETCSCSQTAVQWNQWR